MTIFYSNKKFYPEEFKQDYVDAGSWPENYVELTTQQYAEFSGAPPEGKILDTGKDGFPAWIDLPAPTQQQLIEQAENQRQYLLSRASSVTADWRTELALDEISDDDKKSLIAWMKYIKAVKAVDVSKVPNTGWPAEPAV